MEVWINLIQTFGLAVVILFAVGLGIYKASRWVASEIVIPLRDNAAARFVHVLDKVDTTLAKMDRNVDTMLLLMNRQVCLFQKHAEQVIEASQATKKSVSETGSGPHHRHGRENSEGYNV